MNANEPIGMKYAADVSGGLYLRCLRRSKALVALVVLAFFSAAPVFASTWPVTSLGDDAGDSTTLRGAIASATSGDTINITATGTIVLGGTEIVIDKDLTITGPGASKLTIDGNGSSRVFYIEPAITVDISGLTITGGNCVNATDFAGEGGGIFNDHGTLTLTNTTVSGNTAHMYGGGIYNSLGTLALTNSTVSGNIVDLNAGGILNNGGTYGGGSVALTNSTISGNKAGNGDGGGIYNTNSTMTLTNSTVSGNTSTTQGGGIYNDYYAKLSLTNSTVSGNKGGYYGSGISNVNFSTMTLTNSTISDNKAASYGSGISNSSSTLTIKNTIVANNASGGNCYLVGSNTTSDGHNLSDDSSCTFFDTSAPKDDIIVAAGGAGLDPSGLQNNGGPTQTIALMAGSAAIDAVPAGPASYCTAVDGTTPISTDQRGVSRPQGSACDIGAFEFAANQDDKGPVTSNVVVSPHPVAINTDVTLTANVNDASTGGSNIASADYTINGGSPTPMNAAGGNFDAVSENVTATVAPFAETGVYNLCVNGTDEPGNVGGAACVLLPVYDPSGGFVTGGGFVNSPAGADLVNTSATGQVRFAFVSKYLPGRSTPDGNLEFQFHAGGLSFHSTSIDWLVVTGEPRAQFQGTGTVSGAIACKFTVDTWDSSFAPGGVDAFGLRIFACSDGSDRYSLNATPLTKGSIIIHR